MNLENNNNMFAIGVAFENFPWALEFPNVTFMAKHKLSKVINRNKNDVWSCWGINNFATMPLTSEKPSSNMSKVHIQQVFSRGLERLDS
jgi:hypothetical protein